VNKFAFGNRFGDRLSDQFAVVIN